MKAIKISITSFIDNDQPGWVECKFHDAHGTEHIVHDKVPIVTTKYLNANSEYPQNGVIACEVVREWKDDNGKTVFTVDTSKPWVVETIEGIAQFDVFEEQLTEFKQ